MLEGMIIDAWACRWYNGRVQFVWFVQDKGTICFEADVDTAKLILRGLNETLRNGDDSYELEYDDFAQPFVLPRRIALEFRHHLIKLLDKGEKGAPIKGYASDVLGITGESLVSIETPKVGVWV